MSLAADGRSAGGRPTYVTELLEPVWLAIGPFVALPAVFGVLLVYAVEAVARPGHWTGQGNGDGCWSRSWCYSWSRSP